MGLSCLLMAFIALRLHKLEIHYENLLRAIETYWQAENVEGVQMANITGRVSSRKLVIFTLVVIAIGFMGRGLTQLI